MAGGGQAQSSLQAALPEYHHQVADIDYLAEVCEKPSPLEELEDFLSLSQALFLLYFLLLVQQNYFESDI